MRLQTAMMYTWWTFTGWLISNSVLADENVYLALLDATEIPVLAVDRAETRLLLVEVPDNISKLELESLTRIIDWIPHIPNAALTSKIGNTQDRLDSLQAIKDVSQRILHLATLLRGFNDMFPSYIGTKNLPTNVRVAKITMAGQSNEIPAAARLIQSLSEHLFTYTKTYTIDAEWNNEGNRADETTVSILTTLHAAFLRLRLFAERYKVFTGHMDNVLNHRIPGKILSKFIRAAGLVARRPFRTLVHSVALTTKGVLAKVSVFPKAKQSYHALVPVPYLIQNRPYAVDPGKVAVSRDQRTFVNLEDCSQRGGMELCVQQNISSSLCITSLLHAPSGKRRCPFRQVSSPNLLLVKETTQGTLVAPLKPHLAVVVHVNQQLHDALPLVAQHVQDLVITRKDALTPQFVRAHGDFGQDKVIPTGLNDTDLQKIFKPTPPIVRLFSQQWRNGVYALSIVIQGASVVMIVLGCLYKCRPRLTRRFLGYAVPKDDPALKVGRIGRKKKRKFRIVRLPEKTPLPTAPIAEVGEMIFKIEENK